MSDHSPLPFPADPARLIPYLTDEELARLKFLTAERERFDKMTVEEQRIENLRVSFGRTPAAFFREAWKVLEPGKELEWSWHYDLIGEYLQAVFLGQIRRLIINVPYRLGKSTQATVCFPAWCWIKKPTLRFLSASYSGDLASDHSAKRRLLIESGWYQSLWPVVFSRDTNRRDQYKNTSSGEMIATSPSATATGRGGDILIMDDALSAEEAKSDTVRKARHEWFTSTFRGRLDDPARGAIILIEQRTHADDMTGWLLENEPGQWEHIAIPTECERQKEYSYPITGRIHVREVGDVLQPGRHTPEVIRTRKIHARAWSAQDQQNPTPDAGNLFQRDWWKYRKVRRDRYDIIITSWDFAVEGNSDSDNNAGCCLGRAGADIDVIDVFAERLPFPQQQQALVNFHNKHPYALRHLVEKKANGPAIIASLQSKVSGLIAVEPQGSKMQRADAATPECESGNVYLIEGDWNQDWVEELAAFPNGARDDRVDCFSQGINWLRAHNYSYGLLAYSAQETAAIAASREEYMQTAKMVKPDRGVQSVNCINERCKSASVVRIGNSYHCNSCGAQWPAVKTLDPDAKLMSRANLAAMRR